ncbi:MAG: hypothetical protein ACI9DJ_000407 [Algoriphagus sp.]
MATVSSAGIYTVKVTGSNGCTATGTTAVVFVEEDLVVTASNDGSYNEKDDVNLLATGGPSYSWTGPNEFRSMLAAPCIGNVTPESASTYNVTIQNGACSGTATTEVNIDCSAPGMTYYLAYSDINPEIIAQLVPGLKVQYSATRPMSVIALNNCQLPVIESVKYQLSGTLNSQYFLDNYVPFRAYETN